MAGGAVACTSGETCCRPAGSWCEDGWTSLGLLDATGNRWSFGGLRQERRTPPPLPERGRRIRTQCPPCVSPARPCNRIQRVGLQRAQGEKPFGGKVGVKNQDRHDRLAGSLDLLVGPVEMENMTHRKMIEERDSSEIPQYAQPRNPVGPKISGRLPKRST